MRARRCREGRERLMPDPRQRSRQPEAPVPAVVPLGRLPWNYCRRHRRRHPDCRTRASGGELDPSLLAGSVGRCPGGRLDPNASSNRGAIARRSSRVSFTSNTIVFIRHRFALDGRDRRLPVGCVRAVSRIRRRGESVSLRHRSVSARPGRCRACELAGSPRP